MSTEQPSWESLAARMHAVASAYSAADLERQVAAHGRRRRRWWPSIGIVAAVVLTGSAVFLHRTADDAPHAASLPAAPSPARSVVAADTARPAADTIPPVTMGTTTDVEDGHRLQFVDDDGGGLVTVLDSLAPDQLQLTIARTDGTSAQTIPIVFDADGRPTARLPQRPASVRNDYIVLNAGEMRPLGVDATHDTVMVWVRALDTTVATARGRWHQFSRRGWMSGAVPVADLPPWLSDHPHPVAITRRDGWFMAIGDRLVNGGTMRCRNVWLETSPLMEMDLIEDLRQPPMADPDVRDAVMASFRSDTTLQRMRWVMADDTVIDRLRSEDDRRLAAVRSWQRTDDCVGIVLRSEDETVGIHDMVFWYRVTDDLVRRLPERYRRVMAAETTTTSTTCQFTTTCRSASGAIVASTVAPNPVRDVVTTTLDLTTPQVLTVTLVRIDGTVVATLCDDRAMPAGRTTLPLSIPAGTLHGLYLLVVNTAIGDTVVHRIVVER